MQLAGLVTWQIVGWGVMIEPPGNEGIWDVVTSWVSGKGKETWWKSAASRRG